MNEDNLEFNFELKTSILGDSVVEQELRSFDLHGEVARVTKTVLDTQEEVVRKGLIQLGWAPPDRKKMVLMDEFTEDLLHSLHEYAKETDPHELGLPMYDVYKAEMKDIVKRMLLETMVIGVESVGQDDEETLDASISNVIDDEIEYAVDALYTLRMDTQHVSYNHVLSALERLLNLRVMDNPSEAYRLYCCYDIQHHTPTVYDYSGEMFIAAPNIREARLRMDKTWALLGENVSFTIREIDVSKR